jgi:hypothetical protein
VKTSLERLKYGAAARNKDLKAAKSRIRELSLELYRNQELLCQMNQHPVPDVEATALPFVGNTQQAASMAALYGAATGK